MCAGQATKDIQSYNARPVRDAVAMAEMPFSPLQAMNCKKCSETIILISQKNYRALL